MGAPEGDRGTGRDLRPALISCAMEHDHATLLARVTDAVGAANVLRAPADVEPYLVDHRGRYRGRAIAVVRPGTTAEVSATVRACVDHGVALVPQGGNTGLCGGATPDERGASIVISLARMARVRSVDPENATMTVE